METPNAPVGTGAMPRSSSRSFAEPARRPLAFLPPPPIFQRLLPSALPYSSTARRRRVHVHPCAALTATDPATQYVPLHVHSDFSLLDGASQLPSLVERAAELGVPALALTDHGVLYGAIQLVRICGKSGVKPIIGNEMYIVNDGFGEVDVDADGKPAKPPKKYHLIVLAKNTTGYRNLVKLTTMAHMKGKVGKGIFARPCINKAQLYQYREGLIVSSACLGGEIPQAILNDNMQAARMVATWYRDVFGDDFYLEIQDHGSDEDKKVNPKIIELSRELGIKAIATNDSHFTSCLDAEAHDAMICIQTGKMLSDENRLHYAGNEYFKSVDEMKQCFVDHLPRDAIDEALDNTMGVAAKVEQYDLFGETRIPDFPIPPECDGSHDEYLARVSYEGLKIRLEARQKAGLAEKNAEQQYYQRLDHELKMIHKMGFSSYFLVVWDYVRHAKDRNIPVGPGRGSAAGSLVAFALRITDVDPIPFNLLFERFLNPERKSMPDIDTDFSVAGREEIISYVSERYGTDRVAQIITFNRLTSKAVLKDVARVHAVPYAEADRLAKLIPVIRGKPATLSKMLSNETPSDDFRKIINRNPSYKTWIDKAMRIEGANKTYGIHAAGIVISATPLTDIVPLSKAKHGETITQYAMEDVESLGLLKMDFLGLKNLTVIETALQFINDGRRKLGMNNELDFSVDVLPLDDENTYKLLAEGQLDGIFQLDASAGMRNIVRELRPSSLEDISSILALYRPGPLDAGLIPKFIRRKHGREAIEYDHPLLEPILRETYGIMVYQEQIMRIARDLAGYSLGQADILRRAMGKKKTADMEREKPRFVSGAVERGVPEEKAVELFDMMLKFAEYCFNKSHSTAYAYLTYQTAYLKANYPVEYAASLLRSNMSQSDKLVRYLADANASGVRVAPPSINKSDLGFTVDRTDEKEAVVLFGLEAVKAVGESVSSALIEERRLQGPFASIIDLIERVDLRVLNKRAVGALIQAGAFDELHPNRKVLLDQLDNLLALRRKLRDRKKRRESKQLSEEEKRSAVEADMLEWEEVELQLAKDSAIEPDFSVLERLAAEKATLGFYASGHPLHEFRLLADALDCTRVDHIIGDTAEHENTAFEETKMSHALPDGSDVMVLSCVTELKKVNTAKGKKMARWMIEDATARVPGIVFPNAYDIVEQTVTVQNKEASVTDPLPEEASGSETGTAPSDSNPLPLLVVEEDARVVVWGKVDRESSGTAQVVIDDVQRVEDVRVLLATAQFNPRLSNADIRFILRNVASEILEVEPSKGIGRYVDPNGIVRKRRSKTIPLSEKRRLPLILRCLDKAGNISAHMNVGNDVRFPEDCGNLLEALRNKTGVDIEIVAVKDLMGDETQETMEASGNEVQSIVSDPQTLVKANDALEVDVAAAQADQLNEAVTKRPLSVEAEVSSSIMGRSTSQDEAEQKKESASVEQTVSESSTSSKESTSRVYVRGIALTSEEHRHFLSLRRIMESHFVQLMSPKQEESLRASLLRPGRKRTVSTVEANSNSNLPETYEGIPSAGGVATMEAPRPVVADTKSFNGTNATVSRDLGHTHVIRSEAKTENAERYASESFADGVHGGMTSIRNFMKSGAKDNVEGKSSSIEAPPMLPKQHNAPSSRPEPHETRPRGDAAVQHVDVENGLTLVLEEFGFDGVLDAVALVGGNIAEKYAQCPVKACGFSGFDLTRVPEQGVSLRLTGGVVFVREDSLFVLVDVKEACPTAGRKRVRSFGPVVGVYTASQSVKKLPLRTKKAKKSAEAAKLRIEQAATNISGDTPRNASGSSSQTASQGALGNDTNFPDCSFTAHQELEDRDFRASLADGGYALSSMCRAAKLSVDKQLHVTDSVVLSLDGFVVDEPDVLPSATSFAVRTQLEGTLLGTAKVQAEGILSGPNGESTTCIASFRVGNPRLKGRNAKVITVPRDPLFRGDEVSDCLRELSDLVSI